jgi:hypothetical protein
MVRFRALRETETETETNRFSINQKPQFLKDLFSGFSDSGWFWAPGCFISKKSVLGNFILL